jgi:MFS family permease
LAQFGVFEQHYSVNQLKDQPLSTISWIGSLQLSLVLLMGCMSGPLFDAGVSLVHNTSALTLLTTQTVSQNYDRVCGDAIRILSLHDIDIHPSVLPPTHTSELIFFFFLGRVLPVCPESRTRRWRALWLKTIIIHPNQVCQIAMGFLFSPAVSSIGHHFKRHKILAFGIFATGASLGGTVVPIAMRRLFDEVGFPWAVRTREHHSTNF